MRGDVLRAGMCAGSALLIVMASFVPVPTQGGWPNKAGSSVTKLADSIDKLEMHIEQYGSVVPKQPDVWGQARLTKYRRMVETQLEAEKTKFKDTINASINRSDQASFVNSLAIQAAISGSKAIYTKRGGTTVVNSTTPGVSSSTAAAAATPAAGAPPAANTAADTITIPDAAKAPPADFDTALASRSTIATTRSALGFAAARADGAGVALEPIVHLDQLTNYLNHLNQLRRTNEGDDTADAPGYALHLVRIPVSVLPGKKTQQGYGAEITLTAEPVINDSLLPTVFRSLVSNDAIDLSATTMHDLLVNNFDPSKVPLRQKRDEDAQVYDQRKTAHLKKMNIIPDAYKPDPEYAKKQCRTAGVGAAISAQGATGSNPTLSAGDIFSDEMLVALFNSAKQNFSTSADGGNGKSHLLLDLRKIAGRHVQAAYALLSAIENQELWGFANSALLSAIRSQNTTSVNGARDLFVDKIENISGKSLTERDHAVVAMAWAIIYEATLLNEQLLEDMKNVAADRGGACHPGDEWLEFFQPRPAAGTPEIFANYVRARWPIHVFAIDPMTSDQNVADTFSRRRDMQLALSLAFTSGRISAQNFTRFARRLDLDMESVALNRTQVGFSHGDDTFGWRFYPRVQSPPIPSNTTVFFRDLLVGGPSRHCDLNTMRLEPGARECVALVIMPSFVPNVRFDSRTNWFKLSNPKQKEFDLKQDVELGTAVTCLRDASAACQNDNCVRGTDLALLMRSVDQLEHRLPLQTCLAQLPFELTDSGHTVFNHGVTDLGPRLRGYYGEPGASQKDFSVAIVGENFSITETEVITGNIRLPAATHVQLLSRQVMVITIPTNAIPDDGKIDVHVATPYGVSNHLDIQLPKAKPSPTPSAWQLSRTSSNCTYVINTSKRDDQAGYFKVVSYAPAVIAQSKTKDWDSVVVKCQLDGVGSFIVNTRKVAPGHTIDIKSIGQGLLDNLILNNLIDTSLPPESATFTLSVEVAQGSVDPMDAYSLQGLMFEKVDGELTLTFKRRPTDAGPATEVKRPVQQQQQQMQIQLPRRGRKQQQQNGQPAVPMVPTPEPVPEQAPESDTPPKLEKPGAASTGFEIQE